MTAALAPRAEPTPGGRPVDGRDFRLLWAGQAASNLGTSVTSVALPLVAIFVLDADAFQVALLSAATWLPWLLIGLPAGAWVDRWPLRRLMVWCDVVSLVLYLSVPVAAVTGALTLPQLFAVAFGTGTASVFFKTAYQVFLPTLLRAADLPAGNARLQGTEAATQIGGPGLAGLIAGAVGAVWALLFDAFTFLVSALCLAAIRPVARPPAPGRPPLRQAVAQGIRFVVRDRFLRLFAWYGAANNLGLTAYQAILVVFLAREVGLTPGTVGAVMAAMSVGGAVGAFVAPALGRSLGTARAIMWCQVVAMPSVLLIPLTGPGPRLASAVAGGVLVGVGVVAGNVIKGSWRQTYTPHHLLGRVIASSQLLNFGIMPLGAVAGGALATWVGVRPAVWCAAAFLALLVIPLAFSPLRGLRDLPAASS